MLILLKGQDAVVQQARLYATEMILHFLQRR